MKLPGFSLFLWYAISLVNNARQQAANQHPDLETYEATHNLTFTTFHRQGRKLLFLPWSVVPAEQRFFTKLASTSRHLHRRRRAVLSPPFLPYDSNTTRQLDEGIQITSNVSLHNVSEIYQPAVEKVKPEQNNLDVIKIDESTNFQNKTSTQPAWSFSNSQENISDNRTLFSVTHDTPSINETSTLENTSLVLDKTKDANESKGRLQSDKMFLDTDDGTALGESNTSSTDGLVDAGDKNELMHTEKMRYMVDYVTSRKNHAVQDDTKEDTIKSTHDRLLGNETLQDDKIISINNVNETVPDADTNIIHRDNDSLQKDHRSNGQDEERYLNAENAVMQDNNTRDTIDESVTFQQHMIQNDKTTDILNVDVSRSNNDTIRDGAPVNSVSDSVQIRQNLTTQDDNNYNEDISVWQNDLMNDGHAGHELEDDDDPLQQNSVFTQDDEPRDTIVERIPLERYAEGFQEDERTRSMSDDGFQDNTRDTSDDDIQDDNSRDTSDDGARHQKTRRGFTMPPPPPPPLPGFGFLATMQELVSTVKEMFQQQEQDRQRIRFLEHHLRSVVSNLKDVQTKASDSQRRTSELQEELNNLDGRTDAVQQTLDRVQENQTRCFHLLRVFNNSSKDLEAKMLRLSHMCNSCLATTADQTNIQSYLRAHWTLEVDFARVASNVRTLSTTVKDLQDKVSSLLQPEQPPHSNERAESEVSREKNHIKRDMLNRKEISNHFLSDIPVVHSSSAAFLERNPSTTTPLKLPYDYGTESNRWSHLKNRHVMLAQPGEKTDDEQVTFQQHYSGIHKVSNNAETFLELREQPENYILGTPHDPLGTRVSHSKEKIASLEASPLLNVHQSSTIGDHQHVLDNYVSSVKQPYHFTKSPSLALETSFSSIDVKFGGAADYVQSRARVHLNSQEEGSHLVGRESHLVGRESHLVGRESYLVGREPHRVNSDISPSQSAHMLLSPTQLHAQRLTSTLISASDPKLTNTFDQTLTKKPDQTLTRTSEKLVEPSLVLRAASSDKWDFQLASEINGGLIQQTKPDTWKYSSLPDRPTSYLENPATNKTDSSSSSLEIKNTFDHNKDIVKTIRLGSLRHEELITTQQGHPLYSLSLNSVIPELPAGFSHELRQLHVGHGQDIRQLEDRIQMLENVIFKLVSNKTSADANDTYEKLKSDQPTSVEMTEFGPDAQSQIVNLSNIHDTKIEPNNDWNASSEEQQRREADMNDLRQMISKITAKMAQWKDAIAAEGSNRSTIARTCRKVSKLQDRFRNLQLTSKRWFQHFKGHVIRLNNSLQDLQERVEFQAVVQSDQIQELRDILVRAGKDQKAKDEATQAIHANVGDTLRSLSQNVGTLARETSRLLSFIPKDCQDYFKLGFYKSGVYPIKPDTLNQTISVFCLMDISQCRRQGHQVDCHQGDAEGNTAAHQERNGNGSSHENGDSSSHLDSTGGWTIVQRRTTGQLNFTRTWADYSRGFGDVNQEFWIGNDFLNRISLLRHYQLRVVIQDVFSKEWEARYDKFKVMGEDSKYKLVIGGFQGNATDGLGLLNQAEFSTFDRKTQVLSSQCALKQGAGWWYNQCHVSNLNGPQPQGMVWYNKAHRDWVLLKSSLMMIKPIF